MNARPNQRTVIIGAGLAGLAAALELQAAGRSVVVLEAGPRPGGIVRTETLEVEGDTFRFEYGPNTVPASAAGVRQAAAELGLLEDLATSSAQATTRYLWHGGRLEPLPTTPPALLKTPLLSARSKLRFLTERFRKWRAPQGPEPSLADVLTERFGPEVTQRIAGAFVRGVYAGEPEGLGCRSAFPRLWSMLERHGGILRGMGALKAERESAEALPGPAAEGGALLGFRGGFQTLVDGFQRALGEALRTSTRVERLERAGEGWRVVLEGGESIDAGAVVLAVPVQAATTLLRGVGLDAPAATLDAVPRRGVTQVHLGWRATTAPRLPEGFGFLVPPTAAGPDAPGCLGAIFASNLFPDRAPAGGATVTVFRADAGAQEPPDEESVRRSLEDLKVLLAGRPDATLSTPAVERVVHWPQAIPQAAPGHADRMADLEGSLASAAPGLILAGGYAGGVSVDDVLVRGRAAGRRAVALTAAG